MLFNIVIMGKIYLKISVLFFQFTNYFFRQSEVIARDTRRMKHIFIVKKGSIMIWKRLDPDGHTPPLNKHDFDQLDDEKSSHNSINQ